MVENNYEVGNYRNSVKKVSLNTIQFENSSNKKTYTNKNLKHYDKSDRNITIFEPHLIDKYSEAIKTNSYPIELTAEEKVKYYMNPRKLSYDKYGTVDYWFVILMVNNVSSTMEFVNINKVWLPDKEYVKKCLAKEEA